MLNFFTKITAIILSCFLLLLLRHNILLEDYYAKNWKLMNFSLSYRGEFLNNITKIYNLYLILLFFIAWLSLNFIIILKKIQALEWINHNHKKAFFQLKKLRATLFLQFLGLNFILWSYLYRMTYDIFFFSWKSN